MPKRNKDKIIYDKVETHDLGERCIELCAKGKDSFEIADIINEENNLKDEETINGQAVIRWFAKNDRAKKLALKKSEKLAEKAADQELDAFEHVLEIVDTNEPLIENLVSTIELDMETGKVPTKALIELERLQKTNLEAIKLLGKLHGNIGADKAAKGIFAGRDVHLYSNMSRAAMKQYLEVDDEIEMIVCRDGKAYPKDDVVWVNDIPMPPIPRDEDDEEEGDEK